jgi:hypothetical protein
LVRASSSMATTCLSAASVFARAVRRTTSSRARATARRRVVTSATSGDAFTVTYCSN